jgi:Na+-transporting NADH:ubiquinone oxidoreductase subunit F
MVTVLQLQYPPQKEAAHQMMVFLKKLHKWVGLVIGIQVLLWLLSGLMLSQLDPAKVNGKHWAQISPVTDRTIRADTLLEPYELTAEQMDSVLNLSLEVRQGLPVYYLRNLDGATLINAIDGSTIVTSEQDARLLAQQDFTGDGEIISVASGVAPDLETRNSMGDYWRVNFSNGANTSIYISVSTGEIFERRNSYWRVFDFFWMLHIMDYRGHEDLNNVLVIIVALIAIWLGISGFILLFGSFNRHDFYFLNIFGKRDNAIITLIDPDHSTPRQISLRKGSNLFLSLATHDIDVPSICGGGGECGMCRVKFECTDLPEANAIELGLIPKRLREQGYRLACQHEVESDTILHLPDGTLEPGL